MARKKPARPAHRPPSGPEGQRVSDYPRLTVRLPLATKDKLLALSRLHRRPAWELIDAALGAYIRALPADEQRLLAQFAVKASRGQNEG
jgi:hypothetical protein